MRLIRQERGQTDSAVRPQPSRPESGSTSGGTKETPLVRLAVWIGASGSPQQVYIVSPPLQMIPRSIGSGR